jgi:trehalose 6-phosphate phosphatase
MKPLLASPCKPLLTQLLAEGGLLAFDYDGTLASIVPDRTQAKMRAETHHLLAQLAHRHRTVLLTGRGREDASRLLQGIQGLEIIGNHGLESDGAELAQFAQRCQEWKGHLKPLARMPGIDIEDKHYSLAVHFRRAGNPIVARAAVLRAAAALDGVRLVGGKDVVNLVPDDAMDKGAALLAALQRHGVSRALYVGDDDTDEDVFSLPGEKGLLTVRVGFHQESAAEYFLRDQFQVDELLALLLNCGQGGSGTGPL